jgi:hypothetical protein
MYMPPHSFAINPRNPRLIYQYALLDHFAASAAAATSAMQADSFESDLLELALQVAHVHDHLMGWGSRSEGNAAQRLAMNAAVVNVPLIDNLQALARPLWEQEQEEHGTAFDDDDLVGSALSSQHTAFMLAALHIGDFQSTTSGLQVFTPFPGRSLPFRSDNFRLGGVDGRGNRPINFEPETHASIVALRKGAANYADKREGCVALQALPDLTATDWRRSGTASPRQVGIAVLNDSIAHMSDELGMFDPTVLEWHADRAGLEVLAATPYRYAAIVGFVGQATIDVARDWATIARDSGFEPSNSSAAIGL